MLFFTRRSQRETFLLQPLVGPQTHESTYLWLCNLFRQKCVRAVAEMFQSFKETQSQPADSRFSQTQKYPIGRRHSVQRLAANGLKGPRKRRTELQSAFITGKHSQPCTITPRLL